jgi:serine/threonine-protein kinase
MQQRLWPDGTFVDFDHGLNTAINKIREALGDSADNPRFVETLARRGYRFIGIVETASRNIRPEELLKQGTVEPIASELDNSLSSLSGSLVGEKPRIDGVLSPTDVRDKSTATGSSAVRTGNLETVIPSRRKRAALWGVGGVLTVVAIIFVALVWRSAPPVSQPLIRLSVDLPDFTLASKGPSAILSPDGSRLVYTGRGTDGVSRLYTRMLNREEATPLAETENGELPFISPDGQWIGFFVPSGGAYKLKKISVEGGPATLLADVMDSLGASWGEDGNIITSLDLAGLSRVPSGGGKIEPVAGSHTVPRKIITFALQVLPRAEAVLLWSC